MMTIKCQKSSALNPAVRLMFVMADAEARLGLNSLAGGCSSGRVSIEQEKNKIHVVL
jgi:hypothetical protein